MEPQVSIDKEFSMVAQEEQQKDVIMNESEQKILNTTKYHECIVFNEKIYTQQDILNILQKNIYNPKVLHTHPTRSPLYISHHDRSLSIVLTNIFLNVIVDLSCEIIFSIVVSARKNHADHKIIQPKTFVKLTKTLEDYPMGEYAI